MMENHVSKVMFSGEIEWKLTLSHDYFSVFLPYDAAYIPAVVLAQPNRYLHGHKWIMTILTCCLQSKPCNKSAPHMFKHR